MATELPEIIHSKKWRVCDYFPNITLTDSIEINIYSDACYSITAVDSKHRIGINQSELFLMLNQLQSIAIIYAVRYIKMNYDGTRFR